MDDDDDDGCDFFSNFCGATGTVVLSPRTAWTMLSTVASNDALMFFLMLARFALPISPIFSDSASASVLVLSTICLASSFARVIICCFSFSISSSEWVIMRLSFPRRDHASRRCHFQAQIEH